MNIIQRFMRFFFNLLYHPFAFTYDLVAWVVSFGRWNDWVFSIVPFIKGTRILELGHGPGHLQRLLLSRGLFAAALDESKQMGRLAKYRIGDSANLTRGLAQSLPYADETFESVVATFPSEYIFDPRTLSEVRRVLRSSGRLIVLPVALPKNLFLRWLYKVTGESPSEINGFIQHRLQQPFATANFHAEIEMIEVKSSTLLFVIAEKEEK
ncbi:MAG: methyltransferase domain-containing protein [Anaerolineales bacterium]|nr:MAG: methyltransferase domain-containing protein [Anaerolineales bacterium]